MIWATWITAISTLVMAIATILMALFAGIALNTWKKEQKRQKLINLLETLNKYFQDLQYYELESTIFSRQARKNNQENFSDNEMILQQANIIDIELAEGYGECILSMRNWLLQNDIQNKFLDDFIKIIQEYRVKTFDYICSKINLFVEKNKAENLMYGIDKSFKDLFIKKKKELLFTREKVTNLLIEFRNINKKLIA